MSDFVEKILEESINLESLDKSKGFKCNVANGKRNAARGYARERISSETKTRFNLAVDRIDSHSENDSDLYIYFEGKYGQNYFKVGGVKPAIEKCFFINKELKQMGSIYKATIKTEGVKGTKNIEVNIIFKK